MNRVRLLQHWGRGFESPSRHGYLCVYFVLCCPMWVAAFSTGWPPVEGVLQSIHRIKRAKNRPRPNKGLHNNNNTNNINSKWINCWKEQTKRGSHNFRISQAGSDLTTNKQTPWSESASELYRPSDRRLSAKWLPTFADRVWHVVSVTDPYGRILDFLDRSRYFSIK
jgi:hypothetical protein